MMANVSAGLLMCRRTSAGADFLLVHPGGPYFKRRDDGVWSIPKGLIESGDADHMVTAKREFEEETGFMVKAEARFEPIGSITQKGGKVVHGFAFLGDCDPRTLSSNSFEIEWPPKSNRFQSFPEVDRADWFDETEAMKKILEAQRPFVARAAEWLSPASAT